LQLAALLLQVSGYSDRNDSSVTVYFESCHWAKPGKLGFAQTNDRNDNFFSFYRRKYKHSKELDIHIFYRKKPKKTVILVTGYGKARKTGVYPMTVCVTEMTVLRQV